MMALLMEMGVVERYFLIGSIIIILGLFIVIILADSRRRLYNNVMKDAYYKDTVVKKYKKKINTAEWTQRVCFIAVSAISIIIVRLIPVGDSKLEITVIVIGMIVEIICYLLQM